MLPAIKKGFEDLENRKANFLEVVTEATPTQQTFKPSEADWCMIEVMDHLVLVEHGVLKLIHKKGTKKVTVGSQLVAKVRGGLLNTVLKLPIKVKAPVAAITPKSVRELSQVMDEWAESQKQWASFLSDFPEDKLTHIVFKHPVGGQLNLTQTLHFLREHIYHHLHQLKRIKEDAAYPQKK